jgi:type I restriction enzyme, S subunit
MGRYQGYEKYKDSGVEWLGNIPECWEKKRIRFAVSLINNKVDAESSDLSYMGLEHIESWTGKRIDDENASSEGVGSHFLPNDVLFGKLRPYLAKVYLSETEGLASTEALVLRCDNTIFPGFLKYYILSRDFINIVDSSTFGSKMPRASWDFIGNLFLTFPTLDEQESIAYFLDRKTTQIDALIAKKAALLEKLDEKRTALISHAVTKGLDPSVPMKDSGVEWLGDIPEHWKRGVKLVQLAEEKQHSFVNGPFGSDLLTAELQDDGIPVIYSGDIKTNKFLRKSSRYVTEEKAIQLNFCRVDSGDLLLAKVGDPPGDAAIYPDSEESGIVTQDVVRIKVDRKKATPEYLALLMNSQTGKFIIKCISVEATRSRFSLGDFKGIRLFIPPLNEQVEISRYGEKILIEIGGQQAKIKEAIELLKEYRTALITNAVTGKIDVRQVARV